MKGFMKSLSEYAILFYVCGSAYITIEIFYRNYTDISMFFLGGLAGVLIGGVNYWLPWEMPFVLQMAVGGAIVTALELAAGLVLNVHLGLAIWDYGHLPLNFMGQICLLYGVIWVGLSAAAILLNDWTRHWLFGEQRPKYKIL